MPTTPTTLSLGGTTTSQPAAVERSTDTTAATGAAGMAGTGPHDYVAWLSLAGVASVALGVSMRGRRADGDHWR